MKIYIDLDGVCADLFNHVAFLHNVDHYNSLSKNDWEEFLASSDAYGLFSTLPLFNSANEMIKFVVETFGEYTILSSPLSFDRAGSIAGKIKWVNENLIIQPKEMIFEHDKFVYANPSAILIDDWRININKWEAAGGIAIKYQADEDSLDVLKEKLRSYIAVV